MYDSRSEGPSVGDGDLTCQSGARWEDINQTLKDKNIPLFFPVSPLHMSFNPRAKGLTVQLSLIQGQVL